MNAEDRLLLTNYIQNEMEKAFHKMNEDWDEELINGSSDIVPLGVFQMDKRVYLKIKLKSLAQEAKYIRREERRSAGELRFGLYQHRIFSVRSESRATLLAYGYLNGKSYAQIESELTTKRIDWDKVKSMVKRYGNGEQIEGFEAFMKSATC